MVVLDDALQTIRQLEKCTAPLSGVWSSGSAFREPAEDMILINWNKIWWLPSPDLIFSSAIGSVYLSELYIYWK